MEHLLNAASIVSEKRKQQVVPHIEVMKANAPECRPSPKCTTPESVSTPAAESSESTDERVVPRAPSPSHNSTQYPESHNEVEKRRRAYLLQCYHGLQKEVPSIANSKASNVTVLRCAAQHIRDLQEEESRLVSMKERELQRRTILLTRFQRKQKISTTAPAPAPAPAPFARYTTIPPDYRALRQADYKHPTMLVRPGVYGAFMQSYGSMTPVMSTHMMPGVTAAYRSYQPGAAVHAPSMSGSMLNHPSDTVYAANMARSVVNYPGAAFQRMPMMVQPTTVNQPGAAFPVVATSMMSHSGAQFHFKPAMNGGSAESVNSAETDSDDQESVVPDASFREASRRQAEVVGLTDLNAAMEMGGLPKKQRAVTQVTRVAGSPARAIDNGFAGKASLHPRRLQRSA